MLLYLNVGQCILSRETNMNFCQFSEMQSSLAGLDFLGMKENTQL